MPRFPAAVAVLLVFLPMASGQEARYVQIPFQDNFENLFKARVRAAKDQLDLFSQIQKVAKKLNIDPALINQINLHDPELPGKLADMAKKYRGGTETMLPELEALKTALKSKLPQGDFSSVPKDLSFVDAVAANTSRPRSDLLDRWVRDLARHAKDSTLGDWLRDSPAFKKGIADLETLARFEKSPSIWGLDELPEHLRIANSLNPDFGKDIRDGLSKISLAEMPRVNLPHISLGHWGLPELRLPGLGGSGGARLGEILLWAVVAGAALVLTWHLVKNLGTGAPRPSVQVRLGPWPVDPARVVTRTQLIQAFDYLAVLMLGSTVRTWNHRAIARKLADTTVQGSAAQELALLYERARYTPGLDPLSAHDQAAVRHHLCLLAGVAAS